MSSDSDYDQEHQEKAARLTIDLLVQMTTVLFERSAAYTSLVVLGGYAGLFSIWAFVNEDIPTLFRLWIALLLSFSLAIFVAYEIYKMIFGALLTLRLATLIAVPRTPADLLEAFRQHEERNKRKSASPAQIVIWIIALVLAVSAAVAALVLLGICLIAGIAAPPAASVGV